MKKQFSTLNLPLALVEELKVWRTAWTAAYGKNVSYEQMIRGMLANVETDEPAVFAALEKMLKDHPELMEKMSNLSAE